MNAAVLQLFSEVADLPAEDRDRILKERGTPVDVCAELQSLLEHDGNTGGITRLLTRRNGSGAVFGDWCLALRTVPAHSPDRVWWDGGCLPG